MRVISFMVLLIICAAHGRPNKQDSDYDLEIALPEDGVQNDDNYDYNESEDEEVDRVLVPPTIYTTPQNYTLNMHESVRLPCEVEEAEKYVSIWRKNNEMVFQDTIKFSSFGSNFKIQNKTLIISNLSANETANYTCIIPLTTTDNVSVTHQVFVRTPPMIESLKSLHDVTEVDAGGSIVLTCKALGFPKPTIVWSKKGARLGEGETISIENVAHHNSGDYQCLADNHVEPPAHKSIHISVPYKPEVTIEKLTVNSDENLDSQLICYVKAVPKAEVLWKKNGENIMKSERKHLKHHNHTYILEIKNVKADDFGVYTCSAYNRVGSSEKNVILTGLPSSAEHIKTHQDNEKNIVVVWSIESNSPIVRYEVDYKKRSHSNWKTLNPEVTNPEGNLYTVNSTFDNLPTGNYEAKVRAKNTYGWSEYSPIVEIKNEGHHQHKPHKKPHNHQETPIVILHEPQAFDGSGITEQGLVAQTSEPDILHAQIPFGGAQNDNTAQVPLTQEHQQQLMKDSKGLVAQTSEPEILHAQIGGAQNDNTVQVPHTQEHHQQLMRDSKGVGDGSVSLVPTATLLLVSIFLILYSH